jgi:hypothetical protein
VQKHRKHLIAVACLAALIALANFLSRDHEPTYQGHPLSYWVSRDDVYHESSGEKREAEVAIQQIGTNGLPFLLKWMRHDRPGWRSKAIDLARRLPTWAIANWIEKSNAEILAGNSCEALSALGEHATPILPHLMALLTNGAPDSTALSASEVLARIGTNALPPLVSAIEDAGFSDHRGLVFLAIRGMHPPTTAASAAVRALVHCLSETNIPHMAAEALGDLRADPDVAIPALIACLETGSSGNRDLRFACVEALGQFGTDSLNAVPVLIRCLQDRNSEVAGASATALAKIGLEPDLVVPALTNALRSSSIVLPSVMALGEFGNRATVALPDLTKGSCINNFR